MSFEPTRGETRKPQTGGTRRRHLSAILNFRYTRYIRRQGETVRKRARYCVRSHGDLLGSHNLTSRPVRARRRSARVSAVELVKAKWTSSGSLIEKIVTVGSMAIAAVDLFVG